jgi:hypothetical protein
MLMSATLTRARIPSFCHELVVRLAFRTDVQRTPRRHSGFVPGAAANDCSKIWRLTPPINTLDAAVS